MPYRTDVTLFEYDIKLSKRLGTATMPTVNTTSDGVPLE